MTNVDKPMTKTEAHRWIRRGRDGAMRAKKAIDAGNEEAAFDWIRDAVGSLAEIEWALEERGIRGVN